MRERDGDHVESACNDVVRRGQDSNGAATPPGYPLQPAGRGAAVRSKQW